MAGEALLHDLHGDPVGRIVVAMARAEEAISPTAGRPLPAWSGNMRRPDARR